MANLKITAHLHNGIVAFDDWSPNMAGLLEFLILDQDNKASSNPTYEECNRNRPYVAERMPLDSGLANGHWSVSSPCYFYGAEFADKFRKRWTPGTDSPMPNWGKRKAKWDGGAGSEKSYDLPNYVRLTRSVTWYGVGDIEGVRSLLQGCTSIGKKRSHGWGQITRWEVEEHGNDWSLFGPNRELMYPIPLTYASDLIRDNPFDFSVREWGWKVPGRFPENRDKCAMPVHTVKSGHTAMVG